MICPDSIAVVICSQFRFSHPEATTDGLQVGSGDRNFSGVFLLDHFCHEPDALDSALLRF
jgi:hypothetical protein